MSLSKRKLNTNVLLLNLILLKKKKLRDFPGDPVLKKPPANAGDTGLIPGRCHMPQGNLAHTSEPTLCNY